MRHACACGRDAGRPRYGGGLVPALPRVEAGVVSLLHRWTRMDAVAFGGQGETSAGEAVDEGRRMAARMPWTILVVDDAPSIVRGLTRLLRREGYAVAAASNGCEALAQLHQRPYNVILTDLRMPTLDGRAFSARLQRRWPALCPRVIFLTGVSDDADSQAFLAQSGRPWLRKPSTMAALRRLLQQTLGTTAAA